MDDEFYQYYEFNLGYQPKQGVEFYKDYDWFHQSKVLYGDHVHHGNTVHIFHLPWY